MKKYKYFLFDMDGTLIDSVPLIVEAFQRTFERVLGHREEDPAVLQSTIGMPLRRSFDPYPPEKLDELMSTYIRNYDTLQNTVGIPLFDGVTEMMQAIRERGGRCAIVTSKRIEPTLQLIRLYGFDGIVEATVCREDCSEGKPSPEPVYTAMSKLGVDIREGKNAADREATLFIGDSIHDLRCAKNAGVDVAICDWTRMDKSELRAAQPEIWLDSAMQLADHVAES